MAIAYRNPVDSLIRVRLLSLPLNQACSDVFTCDSVLVF